MRSILISDICEWQNYLWKTKQKKLVIKSCFSMIIDTISNLSYKLVILIMAMKISHDWEGQWV